MPGVQSVGAEGPLLASPLLASIESQNMIQFTHRLLENDITVVDLGGRLDEASCDYFFQCMQSLIEDGHLKIVVDGSELGYVSSIGLGMLIRGQSRIRKKGGELHLASLQGAVADVLRVTHLDRLFDVHPSVDDAAAAIEAPKN